jgi:hypothetical protein
MFAGFAGGTGRFGAVEEEQESAGVTTEAEGAGEEVGEGEWEGEGGSALAGGTGLLGGKEVAEDFAGGAGGV